MVVALGGIAAAAVDLRTRRVPNVLTASVAAAGLVLAATHHGAASLSMALTGCLVGLACMLPGHLLGGTGAGDVKLLAAMGTVLGPGTIIVAFLYTAIAGGFLALTVAMTRSSVGATVSRTAALVAGGGANVADIERPTTDNRFAYAPAIAIGVLAAALTVR
jgi:prepilin peptidase CpaA